MTSLMLGDVKERNTAQPKTRSAKLKIMSPPNTVTQPNTVNWKQVTFSTYQTGDQRNRFRYLRLQAKAFLEEPQQPRVAPRRGNSEASSMRSTEFFKRCFSIPNRQPVAESQWVRVSLPHARRSPAGAPPAGTAATGGQGLSRVRPLGQAGSAAQHGGQSMLQAQAARGFPASWARGRAGAWWARGPALPRGWLPVQRGSWEQGPSPQDGHGDVSGWLGRGPSAQGRGDTVLGWPSPGCP